MTQINFQEDLLILGRGSLSSFQDYTVTSPYKYRARSQNLPSLHGARTRTMTRRKSFAAEDMTEEVTETTRDAPPTHYSFKIQSFSLLSANSVVKYKSCAFELGDYKWKLVLYPKGDPAQNVDDHLSLYLAIDKPNSLPTGWAVNVTYRFFIFDQIRDKYLTLGDAGGIVRRFHGIKTAWGFSKLISLVRFMYPLNGYLVNDTCEFGVEVFVAQCTCGSERLEMITRPSTYKYSWKIVNFSQLEDEYYTSDSFTSGDYKWDIRMNPNGACEGKDNSLSLYFFPSEKLQFHSNRKIYVRVKLCLRNQTLGSDEEAEAHSWFKDDTGLGWPKFISLDKIKDPKEGFLLNDAIVITAEVTVLGSREKNT